VRRYLFCSDCVFQQLALSIARRLPVTITGNPLGATDLIAPAEAYSGTALLLRAHSTLGETLDGTPGVSSSYFGPNATGEALPRIAPVRLGAALVWAQGPWGARLDAAHAKAQTDVPAGQLASNAYTLVNASLTYHQKAGQTNILWFARADNLGDALAYPVTSILTQTAPGKAPLPGRSLKLGVQLAF
jgi:iron complex outermembrane receptor protein